MPKVCLRMKDITGTGKNKKKQKNTQGFREFQDIQMKNNHLNNEIADSLEPLRSALESTCAWIARLIWQCHP
jgi:hypothetical protein